MNAAGCEVMDLQQTRVGLATLVADTTDAHSRGRLSAGRASALSTQRAASLPKERERDQDERRIAQAPTATKPLPLPYRANKVAGALIRNCAACWPTPGPTMKVREPQ
jgi:hypothetical protein